MQLIYKITSPSGKAYIGQTKRFSNRMSSYRTLRCKAQPLLFRSLAKYGFQNHNVEVLYAFKMPVGQPMIDAAEQRFIQIEKYVNRTELLNLTEGGRGNGNRGPQPDSAKHPRVQGEESRYAKLTNATVREIRAVYRKGKRGRGLRQIAERYGISVKLAYNVVNYKTWRHVESDHQDRRAVAQALQSNIVLASEKRTRERWGPKVERAQCGSMKSSAVFVRCTNRSLPDRDICGSHSPEFREARRRQSIEEQDRRLRDSGGRWG